MKILQDIGCDGISSFFMMWLLPYVGMLGNIGGFMLAALVVIAVDLIFGVQAAKKQGEDVRLSRAIRRTMIKIIDYLAFILLAVTLNLRFGAKLHTDAVSTALLVLVFGIEVNSILKNYFIIKGINYRVNIFRWIAHRSDVIGDRLDGIEFTTHTERGEQEQPAPRKNSDNPADNPKPETKPKPERKRLL